MSGRNACDASGRSLPSPHPQRPAASQRLAGRRGLSWNGTSSLIWEGRRSGCGLPPEHSGVQPHGGGEEQEQKWGGLRWRNRGCRRRGAAKTA